MKFPVVSLIAVLSFAPSVSGAQTAPSRKLSQKELPASAHKLVAVVVKGTQRYVPADVIAVSGLKLGQTVSEDDFKRTAEKLGETGAFSDVVYTYSYSPEGTKLELQIKESDKIVPAIFENFVWYGDKELVEKIHQYVPLFTGELPISGNVAEQVADALQALLVQRGSKGQVDYIRAAPEGRPIDSVRFSVSNVDIRIRNVDFPRAGPGELPALNARARKLQGADYMRSKVRLYADDDLLPIYLERGYLKASFAAPEAKLVQEKPEEVDVDVSLPLDAGRQYKLSQFGWSGNKALSADQLNPLLHLAPGQPANAVQLGNDLQAVQKLYRRHGYMAAEIKPVSHLDEASGTATYELQVNEGDLYRMGDVEIHGLDSRTTDRMRLAWGLKEGDPYDAAYPQRFLKETGNLIAPNIKWGVSIHESVNQQEKTVDVELRFTPQGVE